MKLKDYRKEIISNLDSSQNDKEFKSKYSKLLFNLGLNFYSGNNDLDSLIYNSFSASLINPNISLHEEQLRVIDAIINNEGVVVSAPTSFGKTFCIFEYIARFKPRNVVLIVPTLALAREYMMVFLKKYHNSFSEYKVHTAIEDDIEYDFYNSNNIFILTHEKASTSLNVDKIENLSFLVVDEVYKLDTSMNDERTLIFNVAYKLLAMKAEKYVLLAPFIRGIKNLDSLEKRPIFVSSDFSPVVNKVVDVLVNEEQRFQKTDQLISSNLENNKTLIYFPGPNDIEMYVNDILIKKSEIDLDKNLRDFIKWAEKEIHPDWSVVKALKKGYLIHNGKMPLGIRNYLLSIFNNDNSNINKMLCTSTLLEGVNTLCKTMIITKPNRKTMKNDLENRFASFDFFNLVGRTGRLGKYYSGEVYYLKSDIDLIYKEEDAEVEISFELTENSKDIDIQLNNAENNPDVVKYLQNIGMTVNEYVDEIGAPMRFETFKKIREKYENKKDILLNSKKPMELFKNINSIILEKGDPYKFGVIMNVANSGHKKVIDIYEDVKDYKSFSGCTTDQIIYEILKIRHSYLEHSFLNKTKLIKMFLKKDNVDKEFIEKIEESVIKPIEKLFYLNDPQKRMLLSVGVYDSDIDIINSAIGTNYKDLVEMKKILLEYKDRYFPSISLISRYAIESIL